MAGQHDLMDPLDDIRDHEAHPHLPEGESVPGHDIGQPKYQNARPDRFEGPVENERPSRLEEAKDRAKDRAEEEIRDRAKEGLKNAKDRYFGNGAKKGAEEGIEQAGKRGVQQGAEQVGKQAAQQGAEAAARAGTQAAATGGTEAAAGATSAAATGAATGAAATGAAVGAEGAAGAALVGAEGAVAAAGAATAPETAGIGAAAAVVIGIAIAAGAFALKHWKGVVISCLALVVFGIVALAFVANIFKPIATTLNMANKFMSPIQTIVRQRSIKLLGDYAFNGSKAAGKTVGGKLKDLYQAMRDNGFEDRVKNNYGLTIEKGKAAGSVDILQNGHVLGEAKTSDEAAEIMRSNANTTDNILSNEVHAWDWAQHFKVARKMKGIFSVGQLHVPGAETATNGTDIANVIKYQFSTILKPGIGTMTNTVTCFVTSKACKPDGTDASGSPPAEQKLQDEDDASIVKRTNTSFDSIINNIKPENNFAVSRLDTQVKSAVQQLLNDATLPILGFLDFSTGTREINDNPDYAQIPANSRKSLAGANALFEWSSAGQMLAQDFTPAAASVKDRNFTSIEESQAYNYAVYDDTTLGKPLGDDEKINSMSASPMKTFYSAWTTLNSSIINAIPLLQAWKLIRSTALSPFITFAAHTPIYSIFSGIISHIPVIGHLIDAFVKSPITEIISTSFGLSTKLLVPLYDPAEHGPDYGNYMGSGFHVIGQEACKLFGCSTNLTAAQTQELRVAHEQDNQAYLASLPLNQRLFALTVPNSFINLAILRSPIKYAATQNAAAAISGFFNIVKTLPDNLAHIYSQPAKAAGADPSAIDGVSSNFGISLTTLVNAPLSAQVGQDDATCPTSNGTENMCMGDDSTADAWLARYLGYDAAVGKGL